MSEDLVEVFERKARLRENSAKYRKTHLAEVVARNKAWRQVNPAKVKANIEAHPERVNRWRNENPTKAQAWVDLNRDKTHTYSRRKNYGPGSVEHYESQLEIQDMCCAICSKSLAKDSLGRNPHQDHNHETGRLRGVLCPGCNAKVGVIENYLYPKVLAYIKQWSEPGLHFHPFEYKRLA